MKKSGIPKKQQGQYGKAIKHAYEQVKKFKEPQ